MPKKILLLVGDFVELTEVAVAYKCLRSLGFEVDKVCPGRKKGDTFLTALHEIEPRTEHGCYQTYTEKIGSTFPLTADFDSLNFDDYSALWLPGGRSPEYLRIN